MGSTIALVLSFVFVLILVVGFFIGMWRGAKRSALNLVFAIVGGLVAFFVTSTITGKIMDIQLTINGTPTTINDYLVELLQQNSDIATLMSTSPNFKQFIFGLPGALASTVVFIVLTFLIEIVLYVIYKIVCIFFRYKPGESKHRVWGGVIGAVKAFAVTVLAFMPLASLIGLASDLAQSDGYISAQTASAEGETPNNDNSSLFASFVTNTGVEVISGLENNVLTKICGIGGLDNLMFDYMSSYEVGGENIVVRQEIKNYYEIGQVYYDIRNAISFNFASFDYDKIELALDNILDANLFKVVISPTISNVLENYKSFSFTSSLPKEYKSVIDALATKMQQVNAEGSASEYFANDLKEIFTSFRKLGESGVIDEIVSLSDKSVDGVIGVLAKEKNSQSVSNALVSLFNTNILRDSVKEVLNLALNMVKGELKIDKIGADTSKFTDEDWKQTAQSLENVIIDFDGLSKQLSSLGDGKNFATIISNPASLLGQDTTTVSNIFSSLGSLIDNVRGIKILQTSEGKSVLDTMLEEILPLPTTNVVDYANGGVEKQISTYSELFNFITTPFVKMSDSGLYEAMTVTGEGSNPIANVADILAKEGKDDLLREILLPLIQVEPTASLLTGSEGLLTSLGGTIIDFSVLGKNYTDWKSDLGYIQQLLIALNKDNGSGGKYIDQISDPTGMLNSLQKYDISSVIKPLIYAKSTQDAEEALLTSIEEAINSLTGTKNTLAVSANTFVDGGSDDQAGELCDIFACLLDFNNASQGVENMKDVDANILKSLLKAMQNNAYRNSTDTSKTQGLFGYVSDGDDSQSAFVNVMNKFVGEFSEIEKAAIELELGSGYLDKSNYPNINFDELFAKISA